jgi:polar amino acid transport system permease protein
LRSDSKPTGIDQTQASRAKDQSVVRTHPPLIVLPQAMRVIVPPTGNETIAMLKDTSLLIAIPVGTELFFQLQAIGARTFQVFPILVAATLYYLIASSVLMVGQAYLEKRFGRGFGTQVSADKEEAAKGLAVGSAK